jgi:multiple sugar transport system substrate-binding protein
VTALRQQGLELNWDLAPIPTFPEKLGNGRESQVHTLSVNSKSAKKDAAFLVVAHILSDEGQRVLSRNGRVPQSSIRSLRKNSGSISAY